MDRRRRVANKPATTTTVVPPVTIPSVAKVVTDLTPSSAPPKLTPVVATKATVKDATPVAAPTFASSPLTSVASDSDKFIYSIVVMTFVDDQRGSASCSIAMETLQEMVAYQDACKRMLSDLKEKHGEPVRIEKDDDLDDPKVMLNQQLVAAYDCYNDTERHLTGPNAGKMKLSWPERFRRIDAIYEKMRPDPKFQEMSGRYYYVNKTKLTVVKKAV